MSLAINTDNITAVMIGGQWHDVLDGSFNLDAYEMYWGNPDDINQWILLGGNVPGVPHTGFSFETGVG
jgi:hypothetical protein